jgi:hypothetical protein
MTAKPVMSIIAAKAALDAVNALLTGSGCTLKIYSGAQPATTLTSEAGTLGATLTFSSTAIPGSTSGTGDGLATGTANSITSETNAPNSITAGHFRCATSGGTVIMQGNAGTSAADLIMNTTTITAGDTVACSSFKDTLPCGDGVT